MTTIADVRDHLLLDATVSSFIGARLFPLKRPQGSTLPAATYQVISGTRPHTWTGPAGVRRTRVQFSIWSPLYGESYEIGAAIILSLDGFEGALFENERDMMDEDNVFFGRALDYFFWLVE